MGTLANLGLQIGNSISQGMGSISDALIRKQEQERKLAEQLAYEQRQRGYSKEDWDRRTKEQLDAEGRQRQNANDDWLMRWGKEREATTEDANRKRNWQLDDQKTASLSQEAIELRSALGFLADKGAIDGAQAQSLASADWTKPETLAAARAAAAAGYQKLASLRTADRTSLENNRKQGGMLYLNTLTQLNQLQKAPVTLTPDEEGKLRQTAAASVALKVTDPAYGQEVAKKTEELRQLALWPKMQQRAAEVQSLTRQLNNIDSMMYRGGFGDPELADRISQLQSFQPGQGAPAQGQGAPGTGGSDIMGGIVKEVGGGGQTPAKQEAPPPPPSSAQPNQPTVTAPSLASLQQRDPWALSPGQAIKKIGTSLFVSEPVVENKVDALIKRERELMTDPVRNKKVLDAIQTELKTLLPYLRLQNENR